MEKITVGGTLLVLMQGDITLQDTEAVVNAANPSLTGGGGVDGAIHRAGGPAILTECVQIRQRQGELPPGEAVITTGGRLRARAVIHTVGPIWRDGAQGEDQLLRSAYRNSLLLAVRRGVASISFPAISTGAYGFPAERAARIAFATVTEFVAEYPSLREVRFVVFSPRDFDVYSPLFKSTTTP